MELKRAKEVLQAIGFEMEGKERLPRGSKEVYVSGYFTADQLEAIATWMRDPEGVVGA